MLAVLYLALQIRFTSSLPFGCFGALDKTKASKTNGGGVCTERFWSFFFYD
jgi:hypothetical protein